MSRTRPQYSDVEPDSSTDTDATIVYDANKALRKINHKARKARAKKKHKRLQSILVLKKTNGKWSARRKVRTNNATHRVRYKVTSYQRGSRTATSNKWPATYRSDAKRWRNRKTINPEQPKHGKPPLWYTSLRDKGWSASRIEKHAQRHANRQANWTPTQRQAVRRTKQK